MYIVIQHDQCSPLFFIELILILALEYLSILGSYFQYIDFYAIIEL